MSCGVWENILAFGWQPQAQLGDGRRPRRVSLPVRGAILKAFVPRRAAALRGGCHPELQTAHGSLPEDLHRHVLWCDAFFSCLLDRFR
jgi:hypothetical protein